MSCDSSYLPCLLFHTAREVQESTSSWERNRLRAYQHLWLFERPPANSCRAFVGLNSLGTALTLQTLLVIAGFKLHSLHDNVAVTENTPENSGHCLKPLHPFHSSPPAFEHAVYSFSCAGILTSVLTIVLPPKLGEFELRSVYHSALFQGHVTEFIILFEHHRSTCL